MCQRIIIGLFLSLYLLTACSVLSGTGGPANNKVVDEPKHVESEVDPVATELISQEKAANNSVVQNKQSDPQAILPAPPRNYSAAIITGKMTSDYKQLIAAVENHFDGDTSLYLLKGSRESQQKTFDEIQASSHHYVMAIGDLAATSALRLDNKTLMFSAVFNYQSDGLLEQGMQGVSMLPNPDHLFSLWASLNPDLNTVAIITGSGHEQQISRVKQSAAKYGVKIIHRVVKNDKEMLYESELLFSTVQGYWLLPDHRVLSRRSMKEFLSRSLKKAKQVVVFDQQLLKYGGLIYIEAKPADIGSAMVKQLADSDSHIVFTRETNMLVNAGVAKTLHLDTANIPRNYISHE